MVKDRGRPALIASGAFFCLFLAEVVGGRLLTASGGGTGVPDVVQFLVFFASVVSFVVALLQKERAGAEAAPGLPEEA